MLINRTFKPWLVCSKSSGRETIWDCYLDKDAALLISTDGRALSQLPVTIEDGDVSGRVPVDALKAAVKLAGGKRTECHVDLTDAKTAKLDDGRTWSRADGVLPDNPGTRYPNYQQVIPKIAGLSTVRISFNPELLYSLFAAMGADERAGITMEFAVDDERDAKPGPVLVTSAGMSCVLMPFKTLSRAPNRLDDIERAHAVAVESAPVVENAVKGRI